MNGTSAHPTVAIHRTNADNGVWDTTDAVQVTAMGMGDTDKHRPSKSNWLREVNLTVVPNKICEQTHGRGISYKGRIQECHLCTFAPHKDSCSYDSGSPIILTRDGVDDDEKPRDDVLVGMVSWGEECADPVFPAVNSRVSVATDWIDEVVCAWSSNPPIDFGCSDRQGDTILPVSSAFASTVTSGSSSTRDDWWNSRVLGGADIIVFLLIMLGIMLLATGGGLWLRRRRYQPTPVILTSTIEMEDSFQDEETSPSIYYNTRNFLGKLCQARFWKKHLFGIGAILASIASTIDLVEALGELGLEDEDDDDDSPIEGPLQYWDAYKGLMVSSTLLYLIDSVLHVNEECHGGTDDQASSEDGDEDDDRSGIVHSTRIRFAVIFGVAACFDLSCSVTDDEDYPWPSYILECSSVYLFWLAAAMLLYRKRTVYCGNSSPCAKGSLLSSSSTFWFLCLGDWLFFLGCTTDVVVSVLDNPWQEMHYLWSAIGGTISTLFWSLDAVMYQIAGADLFDVVVPTTVGDSGVSNVTMLPIPQYEDDAEDERLDIDHTSFSSDTGGLL